MINLTEIHFWTQNLVNSSLSIIKEYFFWKSLVSSIYLNLYCSSFEYKKKHTSGHYICKNISLTEIHFWTQNLVNSSLSIIKEYFFWKSLVSSIYLNLYCSSFEYKKKHTSGHFICKNISKNTFRVFIAGEHKINRE